MDDLKIDSYIKKRNDNFILNSYELQNINHDFNLIIYYLSDYKIKIIIRKFDGINNGWFNQIILKIYSNDDRMFEKIILGSSTKNWKIINVKTQIRIYKKCNIELKIPKCIYQTYANNNYHNSAHYNCVKNLLEFNPDFDYYFFNDIDCRDFIFKNYNDEILNAYDTLYPVAYKADLFRYLLIYKNGGIYLDNKYLVRNSFYSIIKEDENNVFCLDAKSNLLFNSILISNANNSKFKLLIEKIVINVNNNFYGLCPLHPTGPRLFYEYFKDENIKLEHKVNEPKKDYLNCYIEDKSKNRLLNTFYDGYYNNKNHRNEIINDYDFCFRNKLVYLKKFVVIEDYKFSVLVENNKNIYFQVLLLNENKEQITIQILIQGLKNNEIKDRYKFVFINNKNHKIKYFNLINVFNKIIHIKLDN